MKLKSELKKIAKNSRRDYNFICIQYLQERFLVRLSKSLYRDNFILKGALLLLAYNIPLERPTKDIDFLGTGTSNNPAELKSVFQEIAIIHIDDGVDFVSDDITLEKITEESDYSGIRIRIPANVAGDLFKLQIDIGFGDELVYGPIEMSYPKLLHSSTTLVKAYSLESAIAEKLEAIVSLGDYNSRMKDFYDVWFLLNSQNVSLERLKTAIEMTFNKRGTPIDDFSYIFREDFKNNSEKQIQWIAFLNRNSIDINKRFSDIITSIQSNITQVLSV